LYDNQVSKVVKCFTYLGVNLSPNSNFIKQGKAGLNNHRTFMS